MTDTVQTKIPTFYEPPPLTPISPMFSSFQHDLHHTDPDLICFEEAYQNFMSRVDPFHNKMSFRNEIIFTNEYVRLSVDRIMEQFSK